MIKRLFAAVLGLFGGLCPAECLDCEPAASNGPTMQMEYNSDGQGNGVDVFMYFVPLVAPTSVDIYKDPNTTLNARIISRTSDDKRNSFVTQCVFEITGSGVYETFFDPNEMIAFNSKHSKKKKMMRNMLKSIRMDGPLKGLLEISGTIKDNKRQVNHVAVRFDMNGKSSVTAHLYDIKKTEDGFIYKNRSNEQMARINALTFERGGNPPQMGAEVSSIAGEKDSEGFFSAFKAMIANWFIPPMPITDIGSETMMNFGLALDSTQATFTFPVAENLRQSLSLLIAQKMNQQVNIQ
ncbi:MAG: hypothetical protein JXB18_00125 [Sedimentisphaerales bacterium]|nr:hypothetical protein [Sedimentisphaerales bacterium]